MTPTLAGRWQTRLFLNLTLGVVLSLLFMLIFGLFGRGASDPGFWKLLLLLAYVTGLGFIWDLIYTFFQSFRWDRDWPLSFVFVQGIIEGILVFVLFVLNLLPGVAYQNEDWLRFLLDYGSIWWITYWWLFGPMRIIFPQWRFNGGGLI
ncbi:MAG TPA: hypothetical protein VH186_09725 [Chloroflexia bacterium]|nr:hypothetical protein [Chloroflexia bacterium]